MLWPGFQKRALKYYRRVDGQINRWSSTHEFNISLRANEGNHTVTEYEMSGEPYSQKSGWILLSNEHNFQVMTFK